MKASQSLNIINDDQTTPSVGIGLPVYNNEKYLSTLLDSLLNQTYKNIIIYISDNCSDDGTELICARYAEKDIRIKYHRNTKNIGANANSRKVLSMATTKYFMFSRGHEILSENLVEECVKILEKEDDVVLAFCTTKWIDDDNNVIENKPIGYFDTRGFDVVTRCALVFWGNWDCHYGLSKTSVLKSIRTTASLIGNDTLSLLEKALVGSFAHASSGTRFRRYLYRGETYKKRMERYRITTYNDLKFIDRYFPLARLPYHLFLSIIRSKATFSEKILILLVTLFNAPIRYAISKGKEK